MVWCEDSVLKVNQHPPASFTVHHTLLLILEWDLWSLKWRNWQLAIFIFYSRSTDFSRCMIVSDEQSNYRNSQKIVKDFGPITCKNVIFTQKISIRRTKTWTKIEKKNWELKSKSMQDIFKRLEVFGFLQYLSPRIIYLWKHFHQIWKK